MTGSLLVADLGGTNCRFGIVPPGGDRIENVRSMTNDTASGFIELVRHYLDGRRIDEMVLAVAAPVDADRISLTNRDWVIDRAEITAAFGLSKLALANDFEALGHALAAPAALSTVQVKAGRHQRASTRIILGAGTGFNCSARQANGSVVVCEAGHTTFAPVTELDRRLQDLMTARYSRCSIERLLSGSGLRAIYGLISGIQTEAVDGGMLIERGLAGKDLAALETCTTFARLLGQVAGDLALLFQSTGGLWLSGGPTRAIRPLLEAPDGPFQTAFVAKGRMRPFMETLPIYLVLSDEAAIAGCLNIARRITDHG